MKQEGKPCAWGELWGIRVYRTKYGPYCQRCGRPAWFTVPAKAGDPLHVFCEVCDFQNQPNDEDVR